MQRKCAVTGDNWEMASLFARTFVKKEMWIFYFLFKILQGQKEIPLNSPCNSGVKHGKMGHRSLCPLKQNCTFKAEEVENFITKLKKTL